MISCAGTPDSAEVAESATERVEQTIESVEAARTVYALEAAHIIYALTASEKIYRPDLSPVEETLEDMVIPVVEPKKIEPRKAYIEPAVKVQVVGEASSIKIEGEAGLSLSFGNNFMKIERGSTLTFKPRSARVSVRSYAVGIDTFSGDEYDKALELAEEWKRKKYTVRLIKAGGPLVQADGTVSDTTVYWVALGKFKDEKTAEKFKDKMFSWGI